jgi:hypothetical protein
MSGQFTIDRAFEPRLLGAALGDMASWATWLVVLRAAFGLPLDAAELEVFARVAGSRSAPTRRVRELWAVVGRRAGKSRVSAALAVFSALFVRHKLAAGEVGTVLVLAASRDQAKTIFNYARGFLEASPLLAREVVSSGVHEIALRNGTMIAVHSNSFRTVRGRTLVACIMDEVSFWRDETSATPDVETYRAVLPSLATTNGMLVGISTPYRRMGLLHAKHRDHFGQDGDDVKRVIWRDEHTLVIKPDPYAIAPVDADKFGASWPGLEALARHLRGGCTAQEIARPTGVVVEFKKTPSQLRLTG